MKKDSFNVGDKVFAKVKGYPAWPAVIIEDHNPKYNVKFYGTGETYLHTQISPKIGDSIEDNGSSENNEEPMTYSNDLEMNKAFQQINTKKFEVTRNKNVYLGQNTDEVETEEPESTSDSEDDITPIAHSNIDSLEWKIAKG
ncbi:hypothetical protein FQA39_LY07013 [Lamprigera yunnana]|nr:hypothetical protein FQA39_LY07013 [Lamprigera yunnana]